MRSNDRAHMEGNTQQPRIHAATVTGGAQPCDILREQAIRSISVKQNKGI
jgi:hypothetical protein